MSPGGQSGRLRILGLAGSIREGSYNRALIDAATALAPDHVEFRALERIGTLPHFDETFDATGTTPAAVTEMRSLVGAANGMLIATPEYNHSIPGVLKNALDWLSRPPGEGALIGLPVAITGASTGPWGTRLAQAALRQILTASGSLVLPGPPLYVASAGELLRSDQPDDRVVRGLTELLDALVGWSRRPATDRQTRSAPRAPRRCRTADPGITPKSSARGMSPVR